MDTIFSKQVPITFKLNDKDERKTFLQLLISMQGTRHDSKKDLVVKLTDEQDLLFLYTLRLTESDFQSLKVQQGLLVDFVAFPQKFVDLLEMCIREDSKDNPKFVIHFVGCGSSILGECMPCTLNIVETNPFRHLNHLSLKFVPGSDGDIKSHLASCLKLLKESNSLIQHKYEHTYQDLTSQLQETQELLTSKTAELESLKLEWSSRVADITSKHKENSAIEKEKTIQFQSSLQVRFERERKELEQAHSKLVKQLEARLEEYEANNKELTERKYKSEATIRDLKAKQATLEEENARIKTELHSFRKENLNLDQSCQEKEKTLNHLQTRVAVLEQELKDKAELLTKSDDLFDMEKNKKKHLEADIESKNKEISRLETKVKAMGEEMKKGNEIIKKLQGQIKSYHSKVQLCRQIATEQEKLLVEKDKELEKLRQDLATTKDNLRQKEDENHRLSSNLETATQKLEESKKLLKTNENMIQWLNKQINEQRVNHNHLGNFELSPSTVHPRPAVTVHNSSAASVHGSVLSQDSLRLQGLHRTSGLATLGNLPQQSDLPTGHVQASGQMLGNSAVNGTRRSGIPLPMSQTGTSPTAQSCLNNSGGDKDKNLPLDPKFLMKKEDAIPVRGLISNSGGLKSLDMPALSGSSVTSSAFSQQTSGAGLLSSGQTMSMAASKPLGGQGLEGGGAARFSQHVLAARPQPPLMSAYFPAHS